MGVDQNTSPPEATDVTTSGVGVIAELGPVVEMLEKPAMAKLYVQSLQTTVTVPDLRSEVDVTKSTVYEYVAALQRAGLMTTVDTTDGPTKYTAHEFVFTLEVDGMRVEVTPEIVDVLSYQEDIPEIGAFVNHYGLATLAAFIDLTYEHAAGEVTTRMIADLLDISRGRAYDMLAHVGRILDIGDAPATHHAEDLSASERDALLE